MAPSDRQIINPIGYKTVLGYVTIRAVVRIGIKWVVPDSSQAGIRSVQSTAFLIKIGVGHIQHEAALVTPREFGLEGVRSEEHTSELQSLRHLVCRLLLEKKN